MAKRYVRRPVGRRELRALARLARAEEAAFFARNPHLVRPYRRRLIAVALCQGAALQYLRRGYGVNDFDVHFFYARNPAKPRLSRAVRRIHADVGGFGQVPVDFVRTVVPPPADQLPSGVVATLKAFLAQRPTANARHLAQKAVVLLSPPRLLGRVAWQAVTTLRGAPARR